MAEGPAEGTASAPARQRWFESLVNRDFRLLLGSNSFNYLCNGMEIVVLGWLILDITNSVWYVTLGAFLRFAPVLPMSIVAGTLADRFDRRKILLFNQLGSLATVAAMALLLFGFYRAMADLCLGPSTGCF